MKTNIILIGMAGCGKSTVGVLLAKALGCEFLDTDLVLQRQENKLLQNIINEDGLDYFKRAEERALCSLRVEKTIVATGGSAVYYPAAMEHLKQSGICVWLRLPYEEIVRRIKNISTRGIAIAPGKTLRDVFDEREPLYARYADVTIDCAGGDVERNVAAVLDALDGKLR